MFWNEKRYHTLDYELKKIFGSKVIKLSLDGGFTCPNRDGTLGYDGCLFCSERGSGDFTFGTLSVEEQITKQINLLSKKWNSNRYIVFFQNYTNTYADVEVLKSLYDKALSFDGVCGIAIATRPDCLQDDIINLLDYYNKKYFMWVELGLQTSNDEKGKILRRGYDSKIFSDAVNTLNDKDIKTVAHLIAGLPNENKEDFLASIDFISKLPLWGVKIHLLHILLETDLYYYYLNNKFHLLSKEEYIDWVVESLEKLPPEFVIHRITGDAPKSLLFEPRWSLDKLRVLSGIDHEMKVRGSFQGKNYNMVKEKRV